MDVVILSSEAPHCYGVVAVVLDLECVLPVENAIIRIRMKCKRLESVLTFVKTSSGRGLAEYAMFRPS